MPIHVDKIACCSTATCVSIAPSYFALDPADGKVRVLRRTVEQHHEADVEDAVDSCPTGALRTD